MNFLEIVETGWFQSQLVLSGCTLSLWGNLCGMCGMGYINHYGIHWICAMNHNLMLCTSTILEFLLIKLISTTAMMEGCQRNGAVLCKGWFLFISIIYHHFNTNFSEWVVIISTWEWHFVFIVTTALLNTTGTNKIWTK